VLKLFISKLLPGARKGRSRAAAPLGTHFKHFKKLTKRQYIGGIVLE